MLGITHLALILSNFIAIAQSGVLDPRISPQVLVIGRATFAVPAEEVVRALTAKHIGHVSWGGGGVWSLAVRKEDTEVAKTILSNIAKLHGGNVHFYNPAIPFNMEAFQRPLKEINVAAPLVSADNGDPLTYLGMVSNKRHTAKLKIWLRPFDNRQSRLSIAPEGAPFRDNNGTFHLKIDGRRAWGAPDNAPDNEVANLYLFVDNKQILVPKKLWSDLFDLHLRDEDVAFAISADKTVTFELVGSDGYGSYSTIFAVTAAGTIMRKTKVEG